MGGRAEVGCHTGVRAWSAGPASARALLLLSAGPAPGPRPPPQRPHTQRPALGELVVSEPEWGWLCACLAGSEGRACRPRQQTQIPVGRPRVCGLTPSVTLVLSLLYP